jgi:ribosomal protein S18 acetylase RimI-like enzyme
MVFRDYTEQDYPALHSLWQELDMAGDERGDTPGIIQRTIDLGGKLLVLEDQGMIIGSSWMTVDGRRLFLHHFCIHPSRQGEGLGTRLAEKSMEFIKETGLQVKLEVHKDNHIAKHLYEKLGFFSFSDYDIYMKRDIEK